MASKVKALLPATEKHFKRMSTLCSASTAPDSYLCVRAVHRVNLSSPSATSITETTKALSTVTGFDRGSELPRSPSSWRFTT